MKSKLTKATDISQQVRQQVKERDKYCVLCGSSYNLEIAHFISRKRLGLGVKENLVLLCRRCHYDYDMTTKRAEIQGILRDYLSRFYDETKLKYKKGE